MDEIEISAKTFNMVKKLSELSGKRMDEILELAIKELYQDVYNDLLKRFKN